MGFKELDESLFTRPKVLPFRGKRYAFPGSVSARTGLLLHRMSIVAEYVEEAKRAEAEGREAPATPDLDEQVLDDDEQRDLRAEILGEAQWDLIDDDVPETVVDHMLRTLICWHQFGEQVAQAVWEDVPGAPKAPRDRKRSSRKGSSASGSSTRKRASTRSTRGSTASSPGAAS